MGQIKPKYRVLTLDELQELEKEFIEFLVVNGIVAEDWEKLKKERSEKAEDLLVLFSDVVFEGILRSIQFLEFWYKDKVHCFQCLDKKMILVGMVAKENSEIDFLEWDVSFLRTDQINSFQVFTVEKNYETEREWELFKLMETGAKKSNGALFKQLALMIID